MYQAVSDISVLVWSTFIIKMSNHDIDFLKITCGAKSSAEICHFPCGNKWPDASISAIPWAILILIWILK